MKFTKTKVLLSLLLGILSFWPGFAPIYAHEGHDSPGALPSAPHGGKVKEAMVKGGKRSASELFFEVTYQDKKLTVYPLVLSSDSKEFVAAPKSEVGKIGVRVKSKSSKKKLSLKPASGSLEASFDSQGMNWFDVYVSALHKNESKEAKIHFESN